jgi:hypothetical protein
VSRSRGVAFLLIIATIAAASIFGILTLSFQIGLTKQLSPEITCPNPCLVTITAQGFDSGTTLVVARGTSVVWRNIDSVSHCVMGIGNWSFDTGIIQPGQISKSILFNSDGTFDYYCKLSMLRGEIKVVS